MPTNASTCPQSASKPESSLRPSYGKVAMSTYEIVMRQKRIYLGYDIPAYHARLCKTIRRYGLPRGAPRAWLRDPDFQAWDYLGYMQPSGAMYWQCYLYAALQAAGIDQRLDLSTITILDQRWHFGERAWNFSPG